MKKLFQVFSLCLITSSYGSYLDNWTDNQLCEWADQPMPPSYIIVEVNFRAIHCDDGIAIKTVKTQGTEVSIIENRFKLWKNRLQRWNKRLQVNPFSSEKSIKFISSF